MALKSNGRVIEWGYNEFSQLDIPPGLSDVIAISAGDQHSVALRRDNTVVAWGNNSYGQTNIPVGLNGVVDISAGSTKTVCLKIVNYSDPDFHWYPLTPTDISNMSKELGEIIKVDSIAMLDNNQVRLGTKTVGACFKSTTDPIDNGPILFKMGSLTFSSIGSDGIGSWHVS